MDIKNIEDKNLWEKFVLSQSPHVFLQSWNWGKVHRSLGKKIFRLGLFKRSDLIGVALVIKEEARRGNYFTLPGGPILLEWKKEILTKLFAELKKKAKEEKVVFLRIRPNIKDTKENQKLFQSLGFIKAPMHLHAETTLQIDLTQSLEEILSQMRKNTRYSIRRAEREDVTTEISRRLEDVNLLYRLQMETVKRHQFIPFSEEFFSKHFEAFLFDNQIVLIKADYQGETLAIGMFIFYGNTCVYHYSGSSSKHPKVFASYAMLWRAIQEAKNKGCQLFDLWGIAPTDGPHHRFAGVSLFKKGFGGQQVDYLRAQDLPLSSRYWLTYLFETGRRLKRKL